MVLTEGAETRPSRSAPQADAMSVRYGSLAPRRRGRRWTVVAPCGTSGYWSELSDRSWRLSAAGLTKSLHRVETKVADYIRGWA